jgi:hypothetical protein
MKVSLPGLLATAARSCRSLGDKGTAYSLTELANHLREVREDHSRLQEFFDLYVDEEFTRKRIAQMTSEALLVNMETRPHCAVCGEVNCTKDACHTAYQS